MNSDEYSGNQSAAEITHSISQRLFPLAKREQTRFETKRELLGLFKQGPLETEKEFAERVAKAFQEYQAKKADKRRWVRKENIQCEHGVF
jgi:DNA anti-recombination protein RmuC